MIFAPLAFCVPWQPDLGPVKQRSRRYQADSLLQHQLQFLFQKASGQWNLLALQLHLYELLAVLLFSLLGVDV